MSRRPNPLVHGYSREAIGENIRRERHRGRKPSQSIAIAYSEARRAARARGKRPRYLYRRNPSLDLGPLILIGGAAWLLLRSGGLNLGGSSSPASAPSTSSPTSAFFKPLPSDYFGPAPVPAPVGTPTPPPVPPNAGPGGWQLAAGGPTGMQWVWIQAGHLGVL